MTETLAGVDTPVRSLSLHDLIPGAGLTRTAAGWKADAGKVQFTSDVPLEPGWYRFTLRIVSLDRFGVRKRADLSFDPADGSGRAVSKDALGWNRTLREKFLIELPRTTGRFTLTMVHAEGEFRIEKFQVARIPNPLVALAAVGEKLKLLWQYNCLKPVLLKGGGMLLSGKFGEFKQKVLKGLTDSRVMRVGSYKASEVDAAWWRRHALPADEAEAVRAACDAMTDPRPIAVLIAVDPHKFDEARAAAHSVRREIYPHWELLVACAGPHWIHPHLTLLVGSDPRVKVTLVDEDVGLDAALAKAVDTATCDRIVVLPPQVELSEHALYHFARAVLDAPAVDAVSALKYGMSATHLDTCAAGDGRVWLTRVDRLSVDTPAKLTVDAMTAWVERSTGERTVALEKTLACPIEETPILAKARVGEAKPKFDQKLVIAGDLRGITGWDHITYALLRGLPSCGVKLEQHPIAAIRPDLIPPAYLPKLRSRKKGGKQLAISPPFICHRFEPDADAALFTMWETDTLKAAEVKKVNRFGLVIVPSRWQVDCFRSSGVTVPMAVVPLGFDRLVYHPSGPFPDVCTFGTAGALAAGGLRKNAQKMIDLFRQAFPTEADVRLRVKITPSSPHVETYEDPRIDLLRAVLPHPQLAKWYRSLTAYVNGSFGEGFGLHLIEAMACGRPIITANYSGLTSYFDASVGYPVEYTLVPVENEIYTGRWAEPSDASLVAQMRRVYADRAEAERLGAAAGTRALGFTWKASGRQLVNVLREHGFLTGGGA